MKEISDLLVTMSGFHAYFQEKKKAREHSHIPVLQLLEETHQVLIQALETNLAECPALLPDDWEQLADAYRKIMSTIMRTWHRHLSLTELDIVYGYLNHPHPLQNLFEAMSDNKKSKKSFLEKIPFRKNGHRVHSPQPTLILWPQLHRSIVIRNTQLATIDRVILQLLATPQQIDNNRDFIAALIHHRFDSQPQSAHEFAYQILAATTNSDWQHYNFIREICFIGNVHIKPAEECLRLLPYFALHPSLYKCKEIILIYKGIILDDQPIAFRELLGNLTTPHVVEFIHSLIWQFNEWLSNDEKFTLFLSSQHLTTRLLKDSQKLSQLISERLELLDEKTPNVFENILQSCTKQIGIVLLYDPKFLKIISNNPRYKLICIKRNFLPTVTKTWLKETVLGLEDCFQILKLVEKSHLNSNDLNIVLEKLNIAASQEAQNGTLCLWLQKFLTEISSELALRVLVSCRDIFTSRVKRIDLVEFTTQIFHPTVDFVKVRSRILTDDVLGEALISALQSHTVDATEYAKSDQFSSWLKLPAETVTVLLQAGHIQMAVISRHDFAMHALKKVQDSDLFLLILKNHPEFTLDELADLLLEQKENADTKADLVARAIAVINATQSIDTINRFLVAINPITCERLGIVNALGPRIKEFFAHASLRDTHWLQDFADYIANNTEEKIEPQYSDYPLVLIIITLLRLGKIKQVERELKTKTIAFELLKQSSLSLKEYEQCVLIISKKSFFTVDFICDALATSCDTFEKAQMICACLPKEMTYTDCYEYLLNAERVDFAHYQLAFPKLIFGAALADNSLDRLSNISHVRESILHCKMDQPLLSQMLKILQQNENSLSFSEIKLLLLNQPLLTVLDFSRIKRFHTPEELIFFLTLTLNTNEQISKHLVHLISQLCQNDTPMMLAQSIMENLTACNVERSVIQATLSSVFYSADFAAMTTFINDTKTIAKAEYDDLSQYAAKLLNKPTTPLASNGDTIMVDAKWYVTTKERYLMHIDQLKAFQLKGELKDPTKKVPSDGTTIHFSHEQPHH